jgi:sterol desaturase/sphingolipid hydroxylase (fatty acid hydroxylase superfamily)
VDLSFKRKMNDEKKNRRRDPEASKPLFKNPVLERLTRTHIAFPLLIFISIATVLFYYGIVEKGFQVPFMVLLFFAGFFFFTLIEYLMHRYLYHMPATTPGRKKVTYTMHGVHHDYPRDKSRLAMPPVLSLIIATFFFVLYRALFGDYAFGFLAGFLMGYTVYLGVHYSVHAFKVPGNFLKILWHHHSIHHYREPDRAFGVSSPLWDQIFRTMPRKTRAAKRAAVGESIDS